MTKLQIQEVVENVRSADARALIHRSVRDYQQTFSNALDRAIASLFDEVLSQHPYQSALALVAMGGYGRRELYPRSDIDLLLVYSEEGSIPTDIINALYYSILGAGIDVELVSRTVGECGEIMRSDVRSATSLQDARLIAGDQPLFGALVNHMASIRQESAWSKWFIDSKWSEYTKRHQKNHGMVCLLEPNVKEGAGGLRDLHTALWIGRQLGKLPHGATIWDLSGELTESLSSEIEEAINGVSQVRGLIHLVVGRRSEFISLSDQSTICHSLRQHEPDKSVSPQQFMRHYFSSASIVRDFVEELLWLWTHGEKVSGEESQSGPFYYDQKYIYCRPDCAETPMVLLTASLSLDRSVSVQARHYIRRWMAAHPTPLASDLRLFVDEIAITTQPDLLIYEAVHTGYLFHLIPEIAHLRYLMQYNGFHSYTVDAHVVRAIRELVLLRRGERTLINPDLQSAAGSIVNNLVLILSILFHDIGKGIEGPRHETIGAQAVIPIAKRMGLSPHDSNLLSFLVGSHAVLSRLSFSRDTSDPELIKKAAAVIGSVDNLNMLYVLTYTDIRSVSEELWTPWKSDLLRHFVVRIRRYLEAGGLVQDWKKAHGILVSEIVQSGLYTETEVAEWLSQMPEDYVLSEKSKHVIKHIRLWKAHTPNLPSVYIEHGKRYSVVVVLSNDKPGLFSQIIGTLSVNKISIIDAHLYTGNACVLDVIRTVPFSSSMRTRDNQLIETIQHAINGQRDVGAMMKESKGRFSLRRWIRLPGEKGSVRIDNDVSAFHTVIDVVAHDRVGILYDITTVFSKHGLDIDMAKVSTEGHMLKDSFYLTDSAKHKIADASFLSRLKDDLETCLEGDI